MALATEKEKDKKAKLDEEIARVSATVKRMIQAHTRITPVRREVIGRLSGCDSTLLRWRITLKYRRDELTTGG